MVRGFIEPEAELIWNGKRSRKLSHDPQDCAYVRDLNAVIDGDRPVSGELDLRLTRYFRMSEGFFLRLQIQYDLVEAKRALNGELDRIVPRAA